MRVLYRKKSSTATVSAAANAGPADPEPCFAEHGVRKKSRKTCFPLSLLLSPDTVKNKSRGFSSPLSFCAGGQADTMPWGEEEEEEEEEEWVLVMALATIAKRGGGGGRGGPLLHLWRRRSSESSGIQDILLAVPMPGIRQRISYVINDKRIKSFI